MVCVFYMVCLCCVSPPHVTPLAEIAQCISYTIYVRSRKRIYPYSASPSGLRHLVALWMSKVCTSKVCAGFPRRLLPPKLS